MVVNRQVIDIFPVAGVAISQTHNRKEALHGGVGMFTGLFGVRFFVMKNVLLIR
jgi:hypothetical protein